MLPLIHSLALAVSVGAGPCEGIVVTQRSPATFWESHKADVDRLIPSIATDGIRFVEDLERVLHEGATRDDAATLSPCAKLEVVAQATHYDVMIRDLQGQLLAQERFEKKTATTQQKPLGLKAALRKLGDDLAVQMKSVAPDALYREWAVFPFEAPEKSDLGKLVAGELQVVLIRDYRTPLIERSQVGKVADEYAIQWSGLAQEKVAQDAGALLGADYLVLGEIVAAGPLYRTSARVVRVRDGRVMTTSAVDLPASDLVALSADSVVLKSKSGAFFRSLLVPGWGQTYNLEPTKAWIFGAVEAVGAGAALWAHLRYQSKQDAYDQLGVGGNFDAAAGEAVRAEELRNTILIGLALTHAVNVIDAYLSGVDASSAVAALPLSTSGGLLAWSW